MRPLRITRAELTPQAIAGRILANDVGGDDSGPGITKGQILTADQADVLARFSWSELHLIELEAGDVHEAVAGERIVGAAAGGGLVRGEASPGAWALLAGHRGLVRVQSEPLRRLNQVEGFSVSTVLGGQVVQPGDTVAVIKIVPLAIAEARVVEALDAISGEGVVEVVPFRSSRVGVVVQENGTPEQRRRFHRAAEAKVGWFGSTLLDPAYVESPAESLGSVLERVLRERPDLILVVGAKPMDPLDPVFDALTDLGARLERLGFPAHPGSLLWLARLGDALILGIPSRALLAKATALDIALPHILAGHPSSPTDLADLGHGGLITPETAFRLAPYGANQPRGEAPVDD